MYLYTIVLDKRLNIFPVSPEGRKISVLLVMIKFVLRYGGSQSCIIDMTSSWHWILAHSNRNRPYDIQPVLT